MPLHDWTDRDGWEGMHIYWLTEIARDLRKHLPVGYRAVIGSSPLLAIGASTVKPDVAVTNGALKPKPVPSVIPEPDTEIAVAVLEEDMSVSVERDGRLIAAVELISPRNKDRPQAREQYAARYMNYLRGGVNLLLVDVHRRPLNFSFPQMIAASFGAELTAGPAPVIVSYRVGPNAATGGRMLAAWKKPLTVGAAIPAMPLALDGDASVMVDLDETYTNAAADCYLV